MKSILVASLLALVACGGGGGPDGSGPAGAIDRGFQTEVQAALRSAATAEETFRATTGAYTANPGDLVGAGYRPPTRVDVLIARADAGGYCLQAMHRLTGEPFHLDSTQSAPAPGPC